MSINVMVDLRAKFGPARNQANRPTCMAFAASDTHSFARGITDYLSTEYAHYSAVKRRAPLNPHRGVPMALMIEAIREDGQPPEEVWPYLPAIPSPLSVWVPPNPCGPIFRHALLTRSTDLPSIVSALDAGQPALFAARITEQFYMPPADHIIKAVRGDRDTGNHAIVAVGRGALNSETVVLIRNSWGEGWADNGYAWVTEGYLSGRLLGVAAPF